MNADQLRAALRSAAPKLRAVPVPALGGQVYIRGLTVKEIGDLGDAPEGTSQIARHLAATLCDESGKRILDPDNVDDLKLLDGVDFNALRPAIDSVNEENATSKAALEKLGNDSTSAKS